MGKTPVHYTEQDTKQKRKTYFDIANDELLISHSPEPHIHRIVFTNSDVSGIIPVKSSIFNKLKSKIENWSEKSPLNYWKSESMTFGLSSYGRIILFVKSDLKVFPKEFLRCMKDDFKLNANEIRFLIEKLDFVELEISHKITDPKGKIKGAKLKYDLEPLVKQLIAFTDESHGSLELELKGDPETVTNLEYLLRDKLHAILYFAELTKIIYKLAEMHNELVESINFLRKNITFIIDDILNSRFTEQDTKQAKQKE